MKTPKLVVLISAIALTASVYGQPGGHMMGPTFGGSLSKLFGDNSAFSADIEIQAAVSADQNMKMPGKFAFDSGKSRFEMNLANAKGGGMTPQVVQQMKSMGMDQTVMISRPDTKTAYMIYPGLSAYTTIPIQDADAAKPASAFKIQTTELGKETVNGHPCVKNKALVTDDQGKTHEATLWNASDLNKFPVKIETTDEGRTTTMLFQNVKTSKPDASLFEPPTDYKRYDNPQTMMQQEVMKRMGNMRPGNQ